MATILVQIVIRDGYEADFEVIARDLYQASHAGEVGLLRYEYWRGSDVKILGSGLPSAIT